MPKAVAAPPPHIAVRAHRFEYLPDTRADRTEILTWARALMKPGSRVMLIDEHNVNDGWVTVEEAIQRRRSFAIKVRDDILAIDSDKPDLQHALLELVDALDRDGLRPIAIRSGQPGHTHLWCPIVDPVLLLRYKQLARRIGFDVRENYSLLRPPFAPHRKGRPVAVLATPNAPYQSVRWQTALDNLIREQRKAKIESTYRKLLKDPAWCLPGRSPAATPGAGPKVGAPTIRRVVPPDGARPTASTPGRPWRSLSPKMERLLRKGQPEGLRSEAIQSVALAAVDRGWTEGQFFAALMDPQNMLGAKVRDLRGLRAKRRYVSLSWNKALSYAGAKPAVADRAEVLAEIARLYQAIQQEDWPGVAGTTDRRVLEAHLVIMERAGKLHHGASVREVAEIAGRRAETVSASHKRLRHQGWQVAVGPYRIGTTQARTWRVQVPPDSRRRSRKVTTIPLSPAGGVRETVPFLLHRPLHDVFRGRRGLGLGAALAYDRLDTVQPVRIAALGGDRSTWSRRLCRLEDHRLAARSPRGWLRGTADLDEVAKALGVAGAAAKQRARHARDREAFREHHDAGAVGRLRRSSSASGRPAPSGYRWSAGGRA